MRKPMKIITGRAIPLDRPDVDTDQIMPALHLLRLERSGFGKYAFELWRRDPDFILNDKRYAGAPILLAGRNFGCGSSREHAAWGIHDLGIRCILAPSFADIFRTNAGSNGMLVIDLPEEQCDILIRRHMERPEAELAVDLERQIITLSGDAIEMKFNVDPFVKNCLLKGLDSIDVTLGALPSIEEHEKKRPDYMPTTKKKQQGAVHGDF